MGHFVSDAEALKLRIEARKITNPSTPRATGWIASVFTKDLLVDPKTRNVNNVKHEVVAAASSKSAEQAKKFLQECGVPSSAAAYGSYADLVADKNVEIVYIATP